MALDPDVAGQKAVFRGLDAARQSLDRQNELFFDVRGFLGYEARLNANIKVVVLPDELDPDELVARDKTEWARLVEKAQPIVLHVMSTISADRDLDDRTVKNDIASQVLPLIKDLPDPIERDTYIQKLARLIRVDENVLIGFQPQVPSTRRPRSVKQGQAQESAPAAVAASPNAKVEAYCLGILFRKPELLYRLDRQLQEAGLLSLALDDFDYTDHQIFLKIIRQSLEQVDADHHAYVVNNLPDYISELSRELLGQIEQFKQQDDVLVDDLRRMVKKIRLSKTAEKINQYRFLQEDAQQSGDPRARDYQNETVRLTKLRRLIDNAG